MRNFKETIMNTIGRIHSVETCGTVDGPGIRYVIFLQGCPLHCQYCHNPDTWDRTKGKAVTVPELMEEIVKYRSYMQFSGGGVTVSGGEPLLQPEFLSELFRALKAEGIHTALDTSGYASLEAAKPVLANTDLVLLDIKSYNPDVFKLVTGAPLAPVLEFASYLREQNIPMWVRFVLIPGLTDQEEDIRKMAVYLSGFPNLQKVDVLPFHKMGEFKWDQLGYEYHLREVPPPPARITCQVRDIFKSYGLKTH